MKKINAGKTILDLCGGTGAWSKFYKEAGYTVYNITLPKYDVKGYWFTGEYLCFTGLRIPIAEIYGILAAPVCTMFSLARTRAKTPRDLKQGMDLVIACLGIIWGCRYVHKLAFWALENPMGFLRQFLGKPAFTFDPTDFGEGYTKKTDLWGYFNIPRKKLVKLSEEEKARYKINNRKLPSISDITGSKQSARRAVTPAEFAKAFYKANK